MNPNELPKLELAFPGPERDSGVVASLTGQKTALTGLLQIFEFAQEPIPKSGQRFSLLDSAGESAAIMELTEVRVVPMSAIDDEYARAEGRGYADAGEWRSAHQEFFQSEGVRALLGTTPIISDDTLVVTERFRRVDPH
jgi:dipeptidase E